MADNVTASAGTGDGAVFATDQNPAGSSEHYPLSKLVWGALNTFNIVDAASGKAVPTQGEAAHDAAVTGNPHLNGGEARTTDGTAVSSGDAVRTIHDTLGKQIVIQGALHGLQVHGTGNFTNTTAADLVAAAGAGVKIVITSILVVNGHATVGTKVTIRDKTTTTRKVVGYAAALGGGFHFHAGGRPVLISDANSAIEAVNTTTASDVDVTVSGYTISN
jgi:hypothetical protein